MLDTAAVWAESARLRRYKRNFTYASCLESPKKALGPLWLRKKWNSISGTTTKSHLLQFQFYSRELEGLAVPVPEMKLGIRCLLFRLSCRIYCEREIYIYMRISMSSFCGVRLRYTRTILTTILAAITPS